MIVHWHMMARMALVAVHMARERWDGKREPALELNSRKFVTKIYAAYAECRCEEPMPGIEVRRRMRIIHWNDTPYNDYNFGFIGFGGQMNGCGSGKEMVPNHSISGRAINVDTFNETT